MKVIGPSLKRGSDCEAILRTLPEWFGIEESLQMYVRDSGSFPTFAVEESSNLLGFVSLRKHYEESWEVHCIAVSASYRNRGVGTVLLEHAEAWLAARGACFLQIKTISGSSSDPNYAQTRRFYLARGYTPIEEFPDLWGPTNPVLQLIKRIESAA